MRYVISLIIMFSVASHPLAQSTVDLQPQERRQTEEEKKAAEELEKKTLALVDDLVAEAMSLKLVDNRVYILTGAAEALWQRNEERSRSLIREAMNQVLAQLREEREKAARDGGQLLDPGRVYRGDDSYARGAVMNFLAMRDAKMALEFLQTLRTLRTPDRKNPAEEQQEREQELNLASQIAASDPQTALQIAEKYLNDKMDYQLLNLWNTLQRKDPKAASSLTEKMISELKSQDILGDNGSYNLVFGVLGNLKSNVDMIANAQNNPDGSNAIPINSAEIRQAYRDALDVVVAAALKISVNNMLDQEDASRTRNTLLQIQTYLPDIEKLFPSRIAALRAKMAQFEKARYSHPQQRFYEEYGRDMDKKSPQEMVVLADKAPPDYRQSIYYQAVHKAMNEGDDETARRIVKENVTDKWQTNNLMSEIERRSSDRAANDGKYADARRSLARMASDEQRASALAGWAMSAANKGDRKSAAELAQEARAMIGSRMQRNDQLETQLTIANVAVNLDLDASFEIAEAAIERINRLVAANFEMQTFSGMEEGEYRIISGGIWGGHSGSILPLLAALARKDFDRATALLKQWQPDELRLMLSLSLSQNILSGLGVGNGGGSGRGVSGRAMYFHPRR